MEKNYIDYDAITFAEDPSFVKWVRHREPEATRFWESWEKEHPEKAAVVREASILVQAIQVKESEPTKQQLDQLWSKIEAATTETKTAAPVKKLVAVKETTVPATTIPAKEVPIRRMQPMRWLSYAAAACVAALLFFTMYNPATTVQIGKGDHFVYQLPDQSTIDLNADSKISFQGKSFSEKRVINLEGEAFFEVEKGASFTVVTPNGQVEVLGTSFNVNARNGNLVVDCKTGKVKVTAKGSSETLTPGKGTRLNETKTALVPIYAANIAQQTGWRTGQFHFENTTLKIVIEELERQFDVTISAEEALLNKMGDHNFTGTLQEALEDVCFPLNASPTITGKKVVLSMN